MAAGAGWRSNPIAPTSCRACVPAKPSAGRSPCRSRIATGSTGSTPCGRRPSAPPDAGGARRAPVTRPRPGHADLAGVAKYGRTDVRDILERASARETAARVAAGAVARQLLGRAGIRITSHVFSIGQARLPEGTTVSFDEAAALSPDAPLRCVDDGRRASNDRGDRSRARSRRHKGRWLRGDRDRACLSGWAATCSGTGNWTAGWPTR